MIRGWWRPRGPEQRDGADGVRVPLRSGDIAIGLLLSFMLVVTLLSRTKLRTEDTAEYADPGWDRHVYVAMASDDPFDFGLAPFNRRPLIPALAKAAPGGLQTGFFAVSASFVVIAGMAMFVLGRSRGYSRAVALAVTLLFFSFGWGLKYALADFWIPDAAVLACIPVAMVCAQARRPLAFALVVAVGALAKESVVFAIPLYYTLNAARPFDRRLAREAALVALPAAAVLVTLHLLIAQRNGDAAYFATLPEIIRRFPELYASYDYYALLRDIGYHQRFADRDLESLRAMTTNPFGLVAPTLAMFALRRHAVLAVRLLPFVALVYLQLLFATDTERLLELAGPALCLMAMAGIEDLGRWRPGAGWVAVATSAIAFAFVLREPNAFAVDLRLHVSLVIAATALCLATARRPRHHQVAE